MSAAGFRLKRVGVVALSIALLQNIALCVFAWRFSYFVGDDYNTFWHLLQDGFAKALWIPLGGQVVPLHRAVNFLLYRLAPMNFAVAVAVLAAFHALGVWYLLRFLKLVWPGGAQPVLVVLYAVSPFLLLHFVWLSSGMTRLPYIACALGAMFHYLRSERGLKRDLFATVALGLVALGFYSKGILIPLYCVGADVAWRVARGAPPLSRDWRRWIALMVLVAVAVAYVLWVRSRLDASTRAVNADLAFQLHFQQWCWTLFGHGFFGVVLEFGNYNPSWLVAALWACVFWYTLFRSRRAALAWVIGAVLLAANFALIGLSSRTLTYGGLMAFEYRHYFELSLVAVCFLGIAFGAVPVTAREPEAARFRWLRVGLVAVALGISAGLATRGGVSIVREHYGELAEVRRFMRNLVGDLSRIERSGPPFPSIAEGAFPRYVDRIDLEFWKYSQLLEVLGYPGAVVRSRRAQRRVDDAGHVVSVK